MSTTAVLTPRPRLTRDVGHLAAFLAAALSPIIGAAHAAEPARVDFARRVRPILAESCFECHGPDPTSTGITPATHLSRCSKSTLRQPPRSPRRVLSEHRDSACNAPPSVPAEHPKECLSEAAGNVRRALTLRRSSRAQETAGRGSRDRRIPSRGRRPRDRPSDGRTSRANPWVNRRVRA